MFHDIHKIYALRGANLECRCFAAIFLLDKLATSCQSP
jgi:hypothetical protein